MTADVSVLSAIITRRYLLDCFALDLNVFIPETNAHSKNIFIQWTYSIYFILNDKNEKVLSFMKSCCSLLSVLTRPWPTAWDPRVATHLRSPHCLTWSTLCWSTVNRSVGLCSHYFHCFVVDDTTQIFMSYLVLPFSNL